MKIEIFKMERMQSTWENVVDYNLSESGVHPLTLKELLTPAELEALTEVELGYTQTNGTDRAPRADRPPLSRDRPRADPGHGRLVRGELPADVEPDRARRRGPLRAAELHADVGPPAGLRGQGQAVPSPGEPGLAARPRRAAPARHAEDEAHRPDQPQQPDRRRPRPGGHEGDRRPGRDRRGLDPGRRGLPGRRALGRSRRRASGDDTTRSSSSTACPRPTACPACGSAGSSARRRSSRGPGPTTITRRSPRRP